MNFALSLHQMHEELLEMTMNAERGRKHWKASGLQAEKRVQDAELAMEKAKAKYDGLAEDYDRARTGDRQSGKKFGLKGPKSAAQLEEDLHRKVQAADSDYASKVHNAQAMRQELLSTLRPQALRSLQDLIAECDSGLTMQLQKYATFNERLLLNNGLSVSPLNAPGSSGPQPRSLREVVQQIDNEKDLSNYIVSYSSKVPSVNEIRYQRHPVSSITMSGLELTSQTLEPQQAQPSASKPPAAPAAAPGYGQPSPSFTQQHNRQVSQPTAPPGPERVSSPGGHQLADPPANGHGPPPVYGAIASSAPPQIPPQFPQQAQQPPPPQGGLVPRNGSPSVSASASDASAGPVFGLSLDEMFRRYRSAVPLIVYQCIQAIDLYGLQVEGIYRNNGSSLNIKTLKATFDSGRYSLRTWSTS